MLKVADNERMTRVERDAPMGRMLRSTYWFPVSLSESVEADGAPRRVKLLGENYVVWRSTDGRAAMFDEACPHRRVSLALARNEDNALRCIYHGWKFSVTGEVVEVPTEPKFAEEFCKNVPLRHYPVREAAGIVWAWLGDGDPPPLPDFEFLGLPDDQVYAVHQVVDYNWVQAIEGLVDPAHVTILHQGWLSHSGNNFLAAAAGKLAPVIDIEERPYGFRYAAIREMDDGHKHVRITEFVAPWHSFTPPGTGAMGDKTLSMSIPIDDHSTLFWTVRYNPHQPLSPSLLNPADDRTSWPPLCSAGPDALWGQDREAMKNGSFSGFTQHVVTEDFAVNASQGSLADRSSEFLGTSDRSVMLVRRILLSAVTDFEKGIAPIVARADLPYRDVRPKSDLLPADADWRSIEA
jgi:phthalate 4,5-dioxygenase